MVTYQPATRVKTPAGADTHVFRNWLLPNIKLTRYGLVSHEVALRQERDLRVLNDLLHDAWLVADVRHYAFPAGDAYTDIVIRELGMVVEFRLYAESFAAGVQYGISTEHVQMVTSHNFKRILRNLMLWGTFHV